MTGEWSPDRSGRHGHEPHGSAKAGVMMRNTLTAGSVHAYMDIMATAGSEYMARTVTAQTPSVLERHGRAGDPVLGAHHPGRQRLHGQ